MKIYGNSFRKYSYLIYISRYYRLGPIVYKKARKFTLKLSKRTIFKKKKLIVFGYLFIFFQSGF